jgi:general secretion pathway protein A
MYSKFFGLQFQPFNNTPDPRFFFNTPDHEEALAALLYATQERKGFVLVTGEVGAGKTLLSRVALERFQPGILTATLHNTRINGREMLDSICREFELEVSSDATSPEISTILETFLLEQYQRDRIVAVIVDEAQNLSPEAFEELRLLGNLEADDAKLLQVLILGQPELQNTFRLAQMRQIQQRLFRSLHLKALNKELTRGYIAHRLQVAGWATGRKLFDKGALDVIFDYSRGIPRLINQLCDNVLLAAFADSTSSVSTQLVRDVACQMSGETTIDLTQHRANLTAIHSESQDTSRAAPQRVADAGLDEPGDAKSSRFDHSQTSSNGTSISAVQGMDDIAQVQLREVAGFQEHIRKLNGRLAAISEEATASIETAKVEALARAKSMGSEPAELSAQMRQLLDQTRQQSAALISELRAQVARQAQHVDETWQHAIVDGGKSLVDMIRELHEARKGADEAADANRKLLAQVTKHVMDTKADLQAHVKSAHDRLEYDLCAHEERLARHVSLLADKNMNGADRAGDQARLQVDALSSAVKEASAEFERLSTSMRHSVTSLQKEVAESRKDYGQSAAAMRREKTEILNDLQSAMQKHSQRADQLEDRLVTTLERGAVRLEEQRSAAEAAISQVERVSGAIRDQGIRSVQEVRACLKQMHSSADSMKADLRVIGEDLRLSATTAARQVVDVAAKVDQDATKAVQSARELVDEVRQGTASLMTNANQMFERCYRDAEQTEARLILDSAERFAGYKREGEKQLAQMREVHETSLRDMEQIRGSLNEARQEVSELSDSATQYKDQVQAAHADASRQTEKILLEARDVERRAHTLLAEHQSLASEAQERADAISKMSQTLATVLKQLQSAGRAAKDHHERLSAENQTAEVKLEQMRQHSQRLGQLVGIVRQVYGAIDARVEGLRYGLAAAEQFGRPNAAPKPAAPLNGKRIVERAEDRRPAPSSMVQKGAAGQRHPEGSLGEIVSRNQKLNTWLKEVLKDEVPAENAPAHVARTDQEALTKV